jgi:hypothetical protein
LTAIFQDIKSRLDGGLVSINNGTLNLNGVNLHLVKAGRNGGAVYTTGQVEININNTNFKDISAAG